MAKREKTEEKSNAQRTVDRRIIRSRYLDLKHLISDERDEMAKLGSDTFDAVFSQVESLHELVRKPREQVADAEALLDLANTLESSARSHTYHGLTPSDFVTSILRYFGRKGGVARADSSWDIANWGALGSAVSYVFRNAPGCCTMIGPMKTEIKQPKSIQRRKRVRPTASAPPKELVDVEAEGRKDTDKNMSTMFDILRRNRRVRLENLVLNRASFAQTVENIFALSFLVKDGRAEITVNDVRHHFVSPRNAPAAATVVTGDVSYSHFVFRFDYKDWLLMANAVEIGEEVMPQRGSADATNGYSQPEASRAPSTPIRKLSRNRGLVIQEQPVGDISPEEKEVDRCNLQKLHWGGKKARTVQRDKLASR